MPKQDLLDRLRIDVVAAADHQILGAAGDPEPAILVEPAKVSRIDPNLVNERTLVVNVVEIAPEHAGTGHGDDADLVGRAVALVAAFVVHLDDAHAAVRDRK